MVGDSAHVTNERLPLGFSDYPEYIFHECRRYTKNLHKCEKKMSHVIEGKRTRNR